MAEKEIVVEGCFLGRVLDKFNLDWLLPSMLGADAFTEIFINTESGNQYLIYRPVNEYGQRVGNWLLLNAKNLSPQVLSELEMKNGVLKVGEPFTYGCGGRTTPVTRITCVNTQRKYFPGYFGKDTEESDIRNEFAKKAIKLHQ